MCNFPHLWVILCVVATWMLEFPQEIHMKCITGVKGHVGVSWGQEGVNLLSNALWPSNLVGRTPDQSVMHCWVKGHAGVIRGQPGVKLLSSVLWPSNLAGRILIKVECIAGIKDYEGVSWGQVGVNLLNNALWPPNLVGRTHDQSVMHWWGQRSCKGQLDTTRGKSA